MYCNDISCGTNEMVCLLYKYGGPEYGLNHALCTRCGLVKNVSADNPCRIDYYINIVAILGLEFLR